jgi:hypothetical protein
MAAVVQQITKRSVSFGLTGGTNSGANNLFTFTVPTSLQAVNLAGWVTVNCTDGTDVQSRSAGIVVDAVNKAGTVTAAGTATASANVAASTGTLTITATPSVNGTTVTVQVTPTSSLTPTSLNVRCIFWSVAPPTAGPTHV